MASKAITKLAPEAQTTALKEFIKFYLSKYHNEGLDVIAQVDGQGRVADINQWLIDNANFSQEDASAGLLANRRENLLELIPRLGGKFDDNGRVATPWDDWYTDLVTKLPQGL